jgi:hypothetical protein
LIAASAPDTGSFNWTVPALYSEDCRVRVVARDAALNTGEAVSDEVFTIAPALRTVYNFGTGAGVDKFAYGNSTSSWTAVNGQRTPVGATTALTALQYPTIATSNATIASESDANRYNSPTAGSGSEPTQRYEFTIADAALLDDVKVEWEGFISDCSQAELYVWDYVGNNWGDGRGLLGDNRHMDSKAFQRRDAVLSGNIRSSIGRFIGGTGGNQLTVMAYSERGTSTTAYRMCTDYVAVTTTIAYVPGDLNCDGQTNFDDITAFTTALVGQSTYEAAFPSCYHFLADANSDGNVNFDDIDGFVAILIGG